MHINKNIQRFKIYNNIYSSLIDDSLYIKANNYFVYSGCAYSQYGMATTGAMHVPLCIV